MVTLLFFIQLFSSKLSQAQEADVCQHTVTRLNCVKFVKAIGSDSFNVEIQNVHPLIGSDINVRVRHIDAPSVKTDSSCEKSAAQSAQSLVAKALSRARRIDLVDVERDKNFAILADVIVDGKDLKDLLIKNNLAILSEGDAPKSSDWCQARNNRRESLNRMPASEPVRSRQEALPDDSDAPMVTSSSSKASPPAVSKKSNTGTKSQPRKPSSTTRKSVKPPSNGARSKKPASSTLKKTTKN